MIKKTFCRFKFVQIMITEDRVAPQLGVKLLHRNIQREK